MKLIKDKKYLLAIILLLASVLRFFDIWSNPKAMYGDEITMVYDAYSISQTTQDQKGEKFPLVFQLGGARPPGYVYATVPFAAILGPTALAARLVSVLSGVGIVLLLYLLTYRLINKEVALIAALLGAISPWGISLSRGGFESNFALFLALLGVLIFIRGLKKPVWFILSSLVFAAAMQTYPTYRLTIPLLVILLIFVNFKLISKAFLRIKNSGKKINYLLISLPVGILLFSFVLSLYLMFSIGERDRFFIVNVFQDTSLQAASQKVSLERSETGLPKVINFIFHNRIIEAAGALSKNYRDHFSLEFLFIGGDSNPRHNPAGMGEFLWISPVLLVFAWRNLIKKQKRLLTFMVIWILITPIASSLVGKAHALRSSLMLPPLLILSAVGISNIIKSKGSFLRIKKYLIAVLLIMVSVQFVFLIERIYILAPQMYSHFWSYPAKVAAEFADKNRHNFDWVILSNDIDNMEYAYPTYNRIDPKEVMTQNRQKSKIGEYSFFKYDNVYIGSLPRGNIVDFLDSLPGSVLYIGPAEDKTDPETSLQAKDLDKTTPLITIEKTK